MQPEVQKEVQKTVRLYYGLRAIGAFGYGAVMATYVQFLRARGLNPGEVHMLAAAFYTIQLFAEVPTGAFADRYGRKIAFILSCLLMFLSKVLYIFGHSFTWFLVAEVISGLGLSFSTGAIQAWFVDRVRKLYGDREDKEKKLRQLRVEVFARENMLRNALLAIAALGCSRLAEYSLVAPWVVSAICLFLATILSYYLLTPDKRAVPLSSAIFRRNAQLDDGVSIVWLNGPILLLMTMGILQSFTQQVANINWQPYLQSFLLRPRELGYAFTYILGTQLLGSLIAPRLAKLPLRENLLLSIVQIAFGFGIMCTVMCRSLAGALVFLGVYSVARGLFLPLKDAYLHEHIADDTKRATVASFEALARHVGAVIGSLVAGFLVEHYSMAAAWIVMGAILTASGFYHTWRAR